MELVHSVRDGIREHVSGFSVVLLHTSGEFFWDSERISAFSSCID